MACFRAEFSYFGAWAAGLNIQAVFSLKIGYEPRNDLKIEKSSIAHMACFRAEISYFGTWGHGVGYLGCFQPKNRL